MEDKFLAELKKIIEPFIKAGVYKTEEAALENLVEDIVEVRIEKYKKTIKLMEEKYKTSFSKFGETIKNGSNSIEKENDWMEWEAAINMLGAWTQVKRDLVYAS